MHVNVKKRDMFLIYLLPTQNVVRINMRSIINTKMCLKRKMLTPCQNIYHMIARLILNLHLDPSTTYHNMNLWHFENTSMMI
jgi:hypothetical protein